MKRPSLVLLLAAALLAGCGKDSPFSLLPPGGTGNPPGDFGWVAQSSGTASHLYGLFFADSMRGWAVGGSGVILRTRDAGATWLRTIPTTYTLRAVWFTHPDTGFTVGGAGTVLASADTGRTWTRVTVPASEALNDVWFATPDSGVIVGASGVVLRTSDGGRHWTRSVAPTGGASLNSVVARSGTVWAVGDGGVIVGSHDGGATWFRVLPAVTAQQLRAVWQTGDSAWAVGAQGTVVDGVSFGDSLVWALGPTPGAVFQLHGVCFPTTRIGYVAGTIGTGTIARTDDGGLSWTTQTVTATFPLNDVFFADSLHGWAAGDNGELRHTAHGGHF